MRCRPGASRHRHRGLLVAIVALLAGCGDGGCGDGPAPTNGKPQGRTLAQALIKHTALTEPLVAPYRCARISQEPPATPPALPGLTGAMVGSVLELAPFPGEDESTTLAYVADARGAEVETRTAIAILRNGFAEAGVQIVVSLGGLAETSDELEELFSGLVGGSETLLLALPGDRESIPAHRQAVRKMTEAGARVIDGSRYQLVRIGPVLLANMPGIAMRSNLMAGTDGCQHLDIDASNLLPEGISKDDVVVLHSYAPIRRAGPGAQARGLGAIRVGELALVPLLKDSAVAVAVHAMVAAGDTAPTGKAQIADEPLLLAAGSLDPLERASEALVLTISGRKLRWRRLQVD